MTSSNIQKVCSKCKKLKPLSAFYPRKGRKDGVRSECKECDSEATKNYYKSPKGQEANNRAKQRYQNLDRAQLRAQWRDYARTYQKTHGRSVCRPGTRRRALLKQYKMTEETYIALLQRQSGRCAICGRAPTPGKPLAIDHGHTEDVRVRGLLCFHCNVGLGHFSDSVETLSRAIEYLRDAATGRTWKHLNVAE